MLYSPCELCSLVPHSVVLWRERECLSVVCVRYGARGLFRIRCIVSGVKLYDALRPLPLIQANAQLPPAQHLAIERLTYSHRVTRLCHSHTR